TKLVIGRLHDDHAAVVAVIVATVLHERLHLYVGGASIRKLLTDGLCTHRIGTNHRHLNRQTTKQPRQVATRRLDNQHARSNRHVQVFEHADRRFDGHLASPSNKWRKRFNRYRFDGGCDPQITWWTGLLGEVLGGNRRGGHEHANRPSRS